MQLYLTNAFTYISFRNAVNDITLVNSSSMLSSWSSVTVTSKSAVTCDCGGLTCSSKWYTLLCNRILIFHSKQEYSLGGACVAVLDNSTCPKGCTYALFHLNLLTVGFRPFSQTFIIIMSIALVVVVVAIAVLSYVLYKRRIRQRDTYKPLLH